jgi:hypothetical protein
MGYSFDCYEMVDRGTGERIQLALNELAEYLDNTYPNGLCYPEVSSYQELMGGMHVIFPEEADKVFEWAIDKNGKEIPGTRRTFKEALSSNGHWPDEGQALVYSFGVEGFGGWPKDAIATGAKIFERCGVYEFWLWLIKQNGFLDCFEIAMEKAGFKLVKAKDGESNDN